MRAHVIATIALLPMLPWVAPAQTPAMAQAFSKPAPATPPATNCALVSKDGSAITELTRTSTTGKVSFWTDFTVTCDFSGSVQTFTVPPGKDHGPLVAQVFGAAGGRIVYGPMAVGQRYDTTQGGRGASVTATLNLAAGTQLQIRVGGEGGSTEQGGTGGYNGGGQGGRGMYITSPGGGGASDVRIAPFGDANRLVVAGGGGGAAVGALRGQMSAFAGGAGGRDGGNGVGAVLGTSAQYPDCANAHTGGFGGTQTGPGAGGDIDRCYGSSPVKGPAAIGSVGGTTDQNYRQSGSGGGGGWFGGGAGEWPVQGGGGGGSSHADGDNAAQFGTAVREGNGQIIFQYRVYTKRVTCQNRSIKSLARGSTDVACEFPAR